MNTNSIRARQSLVLALGLAGLASVAGAQGLMSTQGVVVVYDGDPVPDNGGTPIPGYTFGGSSAYGDPVIDETGKLFFRAKFLDSAGPLQPWNDKAYFYGSSRSNLKMLVRGGDQAPGMTAGILLRTSSGSSSSLNSAPRLSPDGKMFWGSTIDDNGVSVNAANNECAFGGPFNSQALLVRKSDIAPGTGGATFEQAFAGLSQQFSGMNRNGRIYFQGTLALGTGTPPVTQAAGSNNSNGIWAGLPGSLELVARKSSPVSGLGGAVAIDLINQIGFVMQMNDSGKLLYEVQLSMTQGAPAAGVGNNDALMVFTPGGGSAVLVREGDVAPGTSGATFNAITGDFWSAGTTGNTWLRNDTALFTTELRGGDVAAGVNDLAVYRGGVGSLAMVVRKGNAAPGTDAVFVAWSNANCWHNVLGQIMVEGALSGGTSTTANDTGIWAGMPGSLQLVVREGDILPGTGGSIAGGSGFSGTPTYFNDAGQVLFNVNLTGGTLTGSSLWAWDAGHGLMPVILPGDQIEVTAGVFKTATGISGAVPLGNTDGASLSFGHDGRLAVKVYFTDGTNALMSLKLPDGIGTPFCVPGQGGVMACVCANPNGAGRGCANTGSAGALLTATGSASLTLDAINPGSVVLTGTDLLSGSTCIFLQGNSTLAAGVPFGGGVRCAGGQLVRLKVASPSGGVASYPVAGDLSISNRSAANFPADVIPAGSTRWYQSYYRDPSLTNPGPGCPTNATFNISSGLAITWNL